MGKLPLRARLATTLGGAAGRMSRLAGRGDGSVIGGVIGLRVEPGLLALLAADRRVVLVTGTNGKTTTTRLITAALGALGQEVASNAFGANMEAGLTAALGQAPNASMAVLETDEKYLPAVLAATRARVVALLNLSRDQMDRAAEIWLVARRWREALESAPDCRVVANADDPLIAWAAGGAPDVVWVAAGQRWHEDSWCCPRVRLPPVPGRARLALRRVRVHQAPGPVGAGRQLGDRLPGPGARRLPGPARPGQPGQRGDRSRRDRGVRGLPPRPCPGCVTLPRWRAATRRWSAADGRCGCCWPRTRPAGWRRSTCWMSRPVPVLLSVNAREPDGRDTSWLWDVDYRVLRGRPVLVTGERQLDLAVRLEADLVPFELADGIDEAVDRVNGRLDVIANYTAFQQIRVTLGRAA